MTELRDGHGSALSVLMERHWFALVRYVTRSVGSVDDAEDVAQEIFVRVWRGRRNWQPGGSVRAYLYRIARNLVLDVARRQQVRLRGAEVMGRRSSDGATPVENTIGSELQADFEQALVELAPRRREAFVLVRLQGLTLKEAAEVMDLTPRTVANHVYLAATDLAAALRAHVS